MQASASGQKRRRAMASAEERKTQLQQQQQQQEVRREEEEDVEEEETPVFQLVDTLQTVGISVVDINKLKEAGITTVGTIFQRPMKDLLAIRGFSEAKVNKIRECATKIRGNEPIFVTGRELRERRRRVIRITTGARSLDGILGGGVETGQITEVAGEFRTGKTQLSHTLCVTSQLSYQMGGGQGKCIYLDTEGNFRPERIEQIAARFGLEVLRSVAALLSDEEQGPFRLLIVDSVIALFRAEFSGRGELAERQQKLSLHLSTLVRLAEEFNIVCLIVNQVCADPGAMSMFGPVMKPVGGHILAHASTTRIQLKKGREDQRIAKIYDSPSMPEADAVFRITTGGIADAE